MRRKADAIFLVAFLFVASVRADWEVVSAATGESDAPAIVHRHLVLKDSGTRGEVTFDLAEFPSKTVALHLIDNPNGSQDLAEALRGKGFVAGVNGGYFDPQFRPLGLRIIDGTVRSPLIRGHLLTGVLCDSARGIEILRVAEFSMRKKYGAAVECGPLLIDRGVEVSSLNKVREARRTFAFVTRDGRAAFGVSSELTLAELAEALAAIRSNETTISRALNLDGGSSSAFYFRPRDGRSFSIAEYKSVRDFVAVGPR